MRTCRLSYEALGSVVIAMVLMIVCGLALAIAGCAGQGSRPDSGIGGDEVLLCWGPPDAQQCMPGTLNPPPPGADAQQRT
jgi:hypothetical protein